jgi:hypothetical protein
VNQAQIVLHSSEDSEWITPPAEQDPMRILERARNVMGTIDLDPASSKIANKMSVHATKIYTIKDNGLALPWHGKIWLNPPYGKIEDDDGKQRSSVKLWLDKLWAEVCAMRMEEGIVLINSYTERQWFWPLWEQWLCFPYRRVRYVSSDGSAVKDQPPHGNAIVYYGDQMEKFADEFAPIGRIVRPSSKVISRSVSELIL